MPPVMERSIREQPDVVDYAEAEPSPDVPFLTVGDGFRFGCGFILAGVAFACILVIVAALSLLLAIMFDIPLPVPLR